ncbi:hypothetical protein [Candidatus Nasuia deltocephalinicola]|uniref:hypothetical protein n=1 Tax=Candidatus Nasuia deltocephalincola TaxID=1160784 RepID=UPI00216B62C5|nr:hypothetical protein [Candidatus Nasuia deltocephalinicola]
MFNGVVINFCNCFFLKYFINLNFFIFKLNKKFFNINFGDSISINGICLTLLYKSFFFFEFNYCYGTFLNISIFKKNFLNFEKSINLFNNVDGHFLLGHINNISFLKKKFFFFNIIKLYIIENLFFKKFFIYKFSISINGLSLTLNELIFLKKFIIISINILNFTYFFTNIKFLKNFDILNIEIDYVIFNIIKNIFYFNFK